MTFLQNVYKERTYTCCDIIDFDIFIIISEAFHAVLWSKSPINW